MSGLVGEVYENTQVKNGQEKYDVKLGIRKWKRYPEYKDSGVEWIGEIPKEWNISNLRYKLKDGNEGIKIGPFGSQLKIDDMQESGFKVYGQENVINRDFYLGLRYINEEKYKELSTCTIYPGDILVSMMGTTGRCQIVPDGIQIGIMDSHLLRLRTKEDEILPYFISLLVDETYYVREQINAISKGAIMNGLNSSLIKSLVLAIPSLLEQKKIIEFLDRETSKINTLIEKKQRLIELLEEKRSALISHAVTKGLDPNIKMKDSGVEWIGKIPDHWNVKPFKHVATRVDVGIAEAATHAYSDEGTPIIRSTNVRPNQLLLDEVYYIQKWFAEKNKSKYLRSGDIVTVRTGNAGVSAVIPSSLHMSQCFTLLISTLCSNQIPQFYCYYLNSQPGKTEFQIEGWGTAQVNISVPILQNLLVPEPPFEEQNKIVNFLDRETEKIDTFINKISAQIEKLKEYRTALISAAVTGKIDVREEVA